MKSEYGKICPLPILEYLKKIGYVLPKHGFDTYENVWSWVSNALYKFGLFTRICFAGSGPVYGSGVFLVSITKLTIYKNKDIDVKLAALSHDQGIIYREAIGGASIGCFPVKESLPAQVKEKFINYIFDSKLLDLLIEEYVPI